MVWIEPLAMETWFINVFAGSATFFAPIAIFIIIGMAAFFRMSVLTIGFMIFIFLLMFSGYIPSSFLIFVSIIGGLLAGITISKIMK